MVVRVAGLLDTVAGGLATVLLEGLEEEEVEEQEETEGWVYAGNVALGGSEEAAVLWEFEAAAPGVLCWACAKRQQQVTDRLKQANSVKEEIY